jgi:peroxiredoxin
MKQQRRTFRGGTVALAVTLGLALVAARPHAAAAEAIVGQPAPSFTLTDTNGARRSLSDYQGKVVVLEWFNHDCPFVRKHYGSGNMQRLQKKWTGAGVIWLSINSSAPGKQGNYPPEKANELTRAKHASPTAVLLDPDGTVGREYGAKTTPHMFVIDRKGTVVYAGGIDDKPSTDQADVATAHNYVDAALTETLAGKPVTVATSTPYGCSVKY